MIALLAGITRGQVARYMLLPQVMPRINKFYQNGFAGLAYLIALVYRGVNILPENHPVLQRQNRKHLGLRQVMAAAAAEIKFDLKNIDKVIIYFAIMIGMVLLGGQFFLTLGYVMANPAMAQGMPTNYGDFFADPAEKDVAYQLLFTVFGVPDLFKAGAALTQYHTALHALFQFYSIGLLVVAVIIVCYFIFAVVIETAQTGVPFGKRYNHAWVPLRLVFALGLLIPMGYGLNAAQWITLYSAKFGSDFATKGWNIFNEVMAEEMVAKDRVGTPQTPQMSNLVAFMMTVLACQWDYEKKGMLINAYLVKDPKDGPGQNLSSGYAGFREAHEYFNKGDIHIRFGERDQELHSNERGNVYPYCGDLIIYSSDIGDDQEGTYFIQQYYYALIYHIYAEGGFEIRTRARKMIDKYAPLEDETGEDPPANFKATVNEKLIKQVEDNIQEAVKKQADSDNWEEGMEEILKYGWGGAGVWYNKIAQINGSLVTAVNNVPQALGMPAVMEYVHKQQLQQNQANPEPFSVSLANNKLITFDKEDDRRLATGLSTVFQYWDKEDVQQGATGAQTRTTNNIIIDVINGIFGTRGLFDMCKSADVHPLAQLSILGKGLVEASIRNIAGGMILGVGTMIPYIGPALGAASSLLLSISTVTISMGFIMFYVIPFMPFLYFFFAVGGWIKGLFEAMVGVPLWALAFLRIDGEGLPGDAALRGIYLIFEVFLRPILIIFGLLASFVVFSAMVKVLNEIFSLVVVNLAGHDPTASAICGRGTGSSGNGPNESAISYFRGPIDEFFFTIIYAIIVYMIGMSCFKLIDLIPDNILRYMGTDAQSFNDKASDPTENMMRNLSVGSSLTSSTLVNDIGGGAAGALGGVFKQGISMASPPKE